MKSMQWRLDRRTFFRRTMLGGAALASVSPLKWLMASPTSRGFKLGVCDWSLGLKENPRSFEVAKQIGLDGVQVDLGSQDTMSLLKPTVQQEYRAAAKRTGMEVASLAIGAMNHVPLKNDPVAARWLAQSLAVAPALGTTLIMPACFSAGDLDMSATAEINHLVCVLKEIMPDAQRQGLTIALENYLSAEDNMRLIDRVGSDALKVYYDVGNSTRKGYDIYAEVRELGKRKLIAQFHAKDGRFPVGQGQVDFRRLRHVIDAIDYRGWIVLESAHPGGVIPSYRQQTIFLRTLFPANASVTKSC